MSRYLSWIAAILVAAFSLRLAAQQNTQIVVTLTDATTGQAVAGRVSVSTGGFSGGGTTGPTDANGTYRTSVAPGSYRISATCTGCSGQSYGRKSAETEGQFLPVKAGGSVRVDFQMQPASVISGRVVDADGDPVLKVPVYLLTYRSGVRGDRAELLSSTPQPSAVTDDHGEYRLFGLNGGSAYYVGIGERLDCRELFFPNTPDPNGAQVIVPKPGAEIPDVNFKCEHMRGVTVRGSVAPPPPQPGRTDIRLVRAGHVIASLSSGPILATNEDGTFEFRNVLPGEYDVTAAGSNGWGKSTIKVEASDIEGIQVMLEPPIILQGRLQVKSPPSPPPSLAGLTLIFDSLDGLSSARAMGQADGTLRFEPLRQGTYRMKIFYAGGSHIERATLDGQDALGSLTVGIQSRSFEMVLAFESGTVEITTKSAAGGPYSGAFVALVGTGSRLGRVDFTFSGVSNADGKAVLSNVAPGTYQLFAWDEQPAVYAGSLFNVSYLKKYEGRATTIRVEAGQTTDAEANVSITPR